MRRASDEASTRGELKQRLGTTSGKRKAKARGEGAKDELAATIRLCVKICTGGGIKQQNHLEISRKKRETSGNRAGKDREDTLARNWSSISMGGYT